MKCRILHDSAGSIRVHVMQSRMTLEQADILEYYLKDITGVSDVKVYDRTCDAIIKYSCQRENIISALAGFSYEACAGKDLVPEHTGRKMNREYEDKLVFTVAERIITRYFFPTPLRAAVTVCRAVGYLFRGIKSLMHKKLEVAVLDAAAITVSVLRGDFNTASSVMFLLSIGDILEEWTHKRSVDDLAGTMALNVDRVWLKNGAQEILLPISDIQVGDEIIVRTGNLIPLDGIVISGEAMVNQASMTGESVPVRKKTGSYVYAGTVMEEGECIIRVDKNTGGGRYDRIVKMIEESEKLKSATEDKASHLADRLVPYSLGGTILTWFITRNATKALTILMVDFSCALKLSMPLVVLSAMREGGKQNISIKGGKFLESVAEVDTIVFDKTGTLTYASPTVAKIIPFGGRDENEMLRLAACLEEHYPHSIANAVVKEAVKRDLRHEERHSTVQYIVAHGISSMVEGEKAVIGSYHFVFQDEGCIIPDGDEALFADLPEEYSHLYLAISGVLAAVICIEDPLRQDARDAVFQLHSLGVEKIVMMTGDNEKTAKAVAAQVGVDAYYAGVLPEDKAAFIRSEHEKNRSVIMVGDGVNDSPALSEADVGIAISDGAAIAREIADITISADELYRLVTLKELSDAMMRRINSNYRFIITFNLTLIMLGIAGIIQPATSALLHNCSTIAISLKSMTKLLK